MSFKLRLHLVLVVLTAILIVPSMVSAAVVTRDDKRGDAPAAIDVTKARYAYGGGRVAVRATIPRLGDRGQAALSISRYEIFEAGYVVRIVKRVGKPARVRLQYFDHFDLHNRKCAGVAGRWNDRSVTLRVPIKCLEGHRTPKVFAQFGIQRGERIDRAPAVKRLPRN